MQAATWIDHFPGNFMWSNAMLVCKGMAPYGAVALDEIDRVGRRLGARQQEPNAWWEEWSAMASSLEQTADARAREGHDATAGNYYLRAGNYYYTGERFLPPGEEKLAMYRQALHCYQAGLRRRYPNIEFVEVPYEGQSLPAYFMKADTQAPAPTVVLFDGMDNCKEMSVLFAGLEFAKRGMHTLAIDGPGQGEALRLRNIYARYDYEVPAKAAYEYVAARPDVVPSSVAVMGYSFGGYYAPRAAAFEKRYAACVAFGAMHQDLYGRQRAMRQDQLDHPEKISQSHFQMQFILGAPTPDAAVEMTKRFTLDGVADKITCPLLVVHGINDRIVPVDAAQALYDAAGTSVKTLKIFYPEEGGAEHCQVDNLQVGVDYIADWLQDHM